MKVNITYKSYLAIVAILFSLISSFEMKASHVMGADISYRMIDTVNGVYEFTLTRYRYCGGINYGNNQLNIVSSQVNVNVNMTLVASETTEVTPLCLPPDVLVKKTTHCPGPNLAPLAPDFIKGVMKEVLKCTFTVGRNIGPAYAAYEECCRNSITTLTTSPALYVQTAFNTDYANNSVVFTSNAVPYWCKGKENTYSIAPVDSFDPKYIKIGNKNVVRDSIAFVRYTPWSGPATNVNQAYQMLNQTVTFVSPLNQNNFLFTTNGVSMNPFSGVIKATPDRDQDAVLAIAVQEWRAIPNANGGYTREMIGYVCRDLQFSVRDNCDPFVDSGIIIDSCYGINKINSNTLQICGRQPGKIVFKLNGSANQTMKLVEKASNKYNAQNFKNYQFNTYKTVSNNIETHFGIVTFDSAEGASVDRLLFDFYTCNNYGMKSKYDIGLVIQYKESMTLDKKAVNFCQGAKPIRIHSTSAKKVSWSPKTGIVAAGPDSVWIEVAPSVPTIYTAKGLDLDTTNTCSIFGSVFIDYKPSMSYTLSPKTKALCFMDSCLIDITISGLDTPYTAKWINTEGLLFDRTNKRVSNTSFNPITYGIKNKDFVVQITNGLGCLKEDTFKVNLNGIVPSAAVVPNRTSFCIGDTTAVEVKISPKFSAPSLFKSNADSITATITAGTINYPTMGCTGSMCYPNIYGTTGIGKSSSTRILYTKSQLSSAGAKAGILKSIAFNLINANVKHFENFTIKMGATTGTTANISVPMFTVYDTKAINPTTGWNTYTFDRGYDWDGKGNVIVEICIKKNVDTSLINRYLTNTSPGGNEVWYRISNTLGIDACDMTTNYIAAGGTQAKPHTRFTMTGIDSSDAQLNYSWSPSSSIVYQNKTKAVLKTSAKDSFFDVKVGNAFCYDSQRLKINLDTNFRIKTFGSKIICRNVSNSSPIIIGATIKSNNPYTVAWTSIPNDPSMSSTSTDTISINPSTKGIYKYAVSVTSFPCQYLDTITVQINDTVSFTTVKTDPTCNQTNGSIISSLPMGNDSSDYNYNWTPNVSNFSKAFNLGAGNYTLQLTLKSDTSCKGQQNISLLQNPIVISVQPQNINGFCIGSAGKLIVKAQNQDSIQWFKDGTAISGATFDTLTLLNLNVSDSGKYYALIYGCPANIYSDTAEIQVYSPAAITQQPQSVTICEGASFSLSVTANNVDSTVWYKNGKRIANSFSFNMATSMLSDSGRYYAIAYSRGSCKNDTSLKALVNVVSTPKITVQPSALTKLIQGSTTTLSVFATNVSSYQWFKDGTSILGANTSTYQIINFDSAIHSGTYTCKLSPISPCSNIVTTSNALVEATRCNPNITATITRNGNILTASMNNGVAPYNYSWNYNSTNSSVTVYGQGNYCVTITDANGCSANKCSYITVTNPIIPCNINANFGFTFNNSGDIQFSDSSTANGIGNSYEWSFGDGTTSNQKNPTKSYVAAGVYQVKLIVRSWLNYNNQYCSDTVVKSISIVNPNPCASITPDFTWSQNGSTYSFINTSNITGYSIVSIQWQFSDGTVSTITSPIKSFSTPGLKTIQMTIILMNNATQALCTKSISKQLNFSTNPCSIHDAVYSTIINNNQVSFYNLSSGTNSNTIYLYKFGNGDSSNVQNPTYTYPLPGLYRSVLYIKSNFGSTLCVDSFVQILQISTSNLCIDSGYTSFYNYQCPDYISPVCGCDNKTYQNFCFAVSKGLKQYSIGPCVNDTSYVTISGYVLNDVNRNCQKDIQDTTIPNVKITINTTPPTIVFTNNNGFYSAIVKKGTYTIFQSQNTNSTSLIYTQICPVAGINVIANTAGQVYGNNNFYDTLSQCQDLSISIHRHSTITPGFVSYKSIFYNNNGATPVQNVKMHYRFLNALTIINAFTPYTVSGNVISWNLGTLPPYYTGFKKVDFYTPVTLPLGTTVIDSVWIEPMTGDCNVANNSAIYRDTCVGSYDPNDKAAYPAGNTDTSVKVIDYLVRFQNTGTAPAHNVVIVDSLENNLDFNTLTLHSTSHKPCRVFTNDNKKVYFEFENIMLPDSGTDYEGSQGYVNFSIKLKENLPIGTQIKNTAAIYFDFNEPVITNTTVNTIYLKSSSGIISKEKDYTLELYPNPTQGEKVTLKVTSDKMQTVSYRIFDLNGREKMTTIERKANGHFEEEIQLNSLSKGIYLIDISINGEASGKIKLVKD
jgi:uncharacterized repeat protein (TIGR01451 family)